MTKWRQERIWIEAIDREAKSIQEWNEKWSFLAEYDQKVAVWFINFVFDLKF
jgi:hypothetical protein